MGDSKRRWLHSPEFDLIFFAGPAALAALAVIFLPVLRSAQTPLWGWLLFVVFIDVGHVYASLYRTYLDPEEFARRRSLYILTPALCWALGGALYALSALTFWRALAYLAVFHFVRQQYGFMRAYSRLEGRKSRGEERLEAATIYATMLYPLVYWHADPSRRFWWFVQGDFVRLNHLAAPWAGFIYAAVLATFTIRQAQRYRQGQSVTPGKLAIVGATAAAWYVGIVATNSDFAFTITNVVSHGVPYFALVWLYGRRRWRDGSWRQNWHRPRSVFLFIGLLLAFAYIEEGDWDFFIWKEHSPAFFGLIGTWAPPSWIAPALVPLLALPQAVHYILDAWIWRLDGSNPKLNEIMPSPL